MTPGGLPGRSIAKEYEGSTQDDGRQAHQFQGTKTAQESGFMVHKFLLFRIQTKKVTINNDKEMHADVDPVRRFRQ